MMAIRNSKKQVVMLVITILMVLTSLFSTVNSTGQQVEADLDPASKILCKFEDGAVLVNAYSTDYFHFLFRSKSAITSTQGVDSSWLNKLLAISGFDFVGANEEILGRPLNPSSIPEESTEEANAAAPKVSAFDRFGMAGMKWSSYQGEWKYYQVDACATQDKISPTTYGSFYEGRLEPQSTHNETASSVDVRTAQFNKGAGSTLLTAFSDTLANAMFSITKTIVTFTILFVGLAFTDITTMLGMLNEDGTSGGTAAGIFTDLFDGIFSGFILFTFVLTGVYILYKGVIKREMRFALNSLIKTLLIFIVATVMASNPSYWIGIPNKAATYGQALMLNSMSGLYEDDKDKVSLCSTEVASIGEGVNINLQDSNSFKSEFEKTNENMRSMIGCQMWETLLFKPWVRGQFGEEYEDLDDDKMTNNNELWVGNASVPLGAGLSVDNWALFHLSVQTNAHAPEGPDSLPTIVNGINSDWWRIVDALSDYEEEIEFEEGDEGVQQEFSVPIAKEPTKFWQSWIGNNRTERLGVAFISIAFGIVGSIAPLVFGLASAVYGLGLTLLMMTSPVFLLLGTWSGKGESIFLGWLSALANTLMKKIGAGILLVLSLSFSLVIMNMIGDIGFIKSFMLMMIVSSLLVKNKDKILDMLADIDFGGAFDPRQKANQFMNTTKQASKEVGKVGAAAVAGSVAAGRSGQNIVIGARTGVQKQLRNQMYTSSTGMNVIRQMDSTYKGKESSKQTCNMCHMPIGVSKEEIAYRDDDGNYFCVTCADEMGLENLYEVVAGGGNKFSESQQALKILEGTGEERHEKAITSKDVRSVDASSNSSWVSHKDMRYAMGTKIVNDVKTWDDEKVQEKITDNLVNLKEDFVVYSNIQMKLGRRSSPPSPPEPLHEYIDLALINTAWNERRFDVVEATYKEAWKRWYQDNGEFIEDLSTEDIEKFKKEIDEHDKDVSEERSLELVRSYMNKLAAGDKRAEGEESKEIYIYSNGRLVLNNADIEATDERLSNK